MSVLGVPQHSKAVAGRFFGKHANGNAAQELFRTNREEYYAIRKSAEMHGLIGPQVKTAWDVVKEKQDARNKERVYTPQELAARAEFDEQTVRALYTKNANTPGESVDSIRKSDPARYDRLHVAAVSYGVVRPGLVEVRDNRPKPAQTPTQTDTTTYLTVPDDLRETFHLPENTKAPADQISSWRAVAEQVRAAKEAQS